MQIFERFLIQKTQAIEKKVIRQFDVPWLGAVGDLLAKCIELKTNFQVQNQYSQSLKPQLRQTAVGSSLFFNWKVHFPGNFDYSFSKWNFNHKF